MEQHGKRKFGLSYESMTVPKCTQINVSNLFKCSRPMKVRLTSATSLSHMIKTFRTQM